MKDDVRNTFGMALKVVWQVVLGISIAAMLCNIGIKQLELHTEIDDAWGRKDLPDGRSQSGGSSPEPTQPVQHAGNMSEA